MNNLEAEIRDVLAKVENEDQQSQDTTTEQDQVKDIYVFVVRETEGEEEDQTQVVESELQPAATHIDSAPVPVTPKLTKISLLPAYAICSLFLILIFSTIAFQMYCLFNPPIATITIFPTSQTMTLNATLQLGRLLQPITISQSQTVPTTGKGHQDARAATGYITFYNGLSLQQTVIAGTVLTGKDGLQIETTQDATIPAADTTTTPPTDGYVTVSAQSLQTGVKGNIAAYDVSDVFSSSITVKNLTVFTGGQDERNYHYVTRSDVTKTASPLQSSLHISMQGALQSQLQPSEQLSILPCSPTITPNHNVGDEAIQVKVTVSETCSAVAYNSQELQSKAIQLLTAQAYNKLGTGYSLFDGVTVKPVHTATTHNLVFLSIQATGTWIYGLSQAAQERIKYLLAGKNKDQAMKLLAALPGIEKGSISISGFTDGMILPKNSRYIHIILLVS
jgi:VCBS repeat-containing protein